MTRHALVFGASGLIGRHVVSALGQAGVRVTAATRSRDSYERLAQWLTAHGQDPPPRVDATTPPVDETITEIHNCAGAYQFGMSVADARQANVDGVRAVVAHAARLPRLRRLVHVSGYRVGGHTWREEDREETYRVLGAYEASKIEADAVFRATADGLGVPWSIVNPSSVIGESDQQLGLAANVKELWQGSLKALPGNAFVPVVAATYLADFMALLPTDPTTERGAYWVLDDDTPMLPDLLTLVGTHLGVRVPRLRIPVPLLRRLPKRLTKADPETLTFLSLDRYPTKPALAIATRHDLKMPNVHTLLTEWTDHLTTQWTRA